MRKAIRSPLSFLLVAFAAAPFASARAGKPAPPVRQATFDVRQEFELTTPEGAQKLRAWLTMPQQDPNQTVKDFRVEAPVPHRIEKDSEGNTLVYLQVEHPPRRLQV